MPATLDEILPGALALPDDSKLLLAERLLESVSAAYEMDGNLSVVVARRHAEAEADPSLLLDADDALREIRAAVATHAAKT